MTLLKDLLAKWKYREIRYFHPEGTPMPNGHCIQRGGYIQECRRNAESFVLDGSVHVERCELSKYKGGVIVFAADGETAELHDNRLINDIRQFVETLKNGNGKDTNRFDMGDDECIGAFSLGNFFKGRYVADNGVVFTDKSVSLAVSGLMSESLLRLAEIVSTAFGRVTVLVKDLNKNKIYLVDAEHDGGSR